MFSNCLIESQNHSTKLLNNYDKKLMISIFSFNISYTLIILSDKTLSYKLERIVHSFLLII